MAKIPPRKRGQVAASTAKTTKATLDQAERIKMALNLRLAGASYRQIAAALKEKGCDVSYGTVRNDVMFALQESMSDAIAPASTLRDLELARLDDMLRQVKGRYFGETVPPPNVHLAAVDRVLKIIDLRAKLMGLHAPTKTDVTSGGAPIGLNAVDTVAGLGKVLAERERGKRSESSGE